MTSEDRDTSARVLLCVNAILEKKAKNLIILNMKALSSLADYFIICSGTSDRQVQAISASVQEKMKKRDILPLGVEGENHGRWVLMDYNDIIIHIFYEPVREFYDIERLWPEAPRMNVDDESAELASLDEDLRH